MSGIDLFNLFKNFSGQTLNAKSAYNLSAQAQQKPTVSENLPEITQQLSSQTAQEVETNITTYQLNNLQNIDRANYAKEVLNFPKNLNEFIYMIQKGITYQQFCQMYSNSMMAQRNALSQMQAQILAQLKGLDFNETQLLTNMQLTSQLQANLKSLNILSNGMINLNLVSQMLQTNGKEAITKLIMSMMEASKAGITDFSQMKDMAKFINASISIASENNPQKTLKLFMLLYLPWLPLEDGVDFDIEMQKQENGESVDDSILVVTITTRNYGIVKATLLLESSNSVQILIECREDFPKTELYNRINKEQKYYSVDSTIDFSQSKDLQAKNFDKQSANINMSQTTEINPYLLLMAHAIIKNVIDMDNMNNR